MTVKTKNRLTSIKKKYTKLNNIRNWRGLLPLFVFVVLAAPSGLYLAFKVPAMWAPDGGAHVARVFQIAEGGFRPVYINHEHGIGYGGSIPVNVNDLKTLELTVVGEDGQPGAERETKLITPQEKQQIKGINSQKISKQRVLISFVNTAAYSPVAYAPNVIGVVIGKYLNLNLGHTLILSKLCGFLVFLLCCGYGLYSLRKSQLKWALLTVSLLPLTIFQASQITADSFLISVIVLFSAIIIKMLLTNIKITKLDAILLLLCIVTIPLVKSVYFPLVFLVLFVGKNRWPQELPYKLLTAISLTISTLGFVIWSKMTADVAASNGLVRGDMLWHYGDAKIQEKFILQHPFGYIHAIIDSFIYQSKFYTDTFFGWLGFTYLPIPGLAQVAGFLALGLSVMLGGINKVKRYIPWALTGAILLVSLLMFTVFYVSFSLPKETLVEGVQGRYFLPMTVLIIATLSSFLPKLKISASGVNNAKYLLLSLTTFCLLLSVLRYGLAL